MKITRSMAERVAKDALVKLKNVYESAEKTFREYAYELAKLALPSEVRVNYQEYPDYFKRSNCERFQYQGKQGDSVQDWEYYNFPSKAYLPTTQQLATITAQEYNQLQLYKKAVQAAKKHYDKECETLQAVLESLRTVKRAKEELPEIANLWPTEAATTALVVDTSKAKEILSRVK